MRHFYSFLLCIVTVIATTSTAAGQGRSGGSPPSPGPDSGEASPPTPGRTSDGSAADQGRAPVGSAADQDRQRNPAPTGRGTQPPSPVPIQISPGPSGPTSDGLLFTGAAPFPSVPPPNAVVSDPRPSAAPDPRPSAGPPFQTGTSGPEPSPGAPAARPCSPGDASSSGRRGAAPPSTSSNTSTQFPGVTASQFRPAGVGAEAFTRPGVSAAQLATLVPGRSSAACTPSRDVVLNPEPVNAPPPIPAADDEP